MAKTTPGYYTPIHGMDPEKIHRALAALNAENGNQGATAEEVAGRSGVELDKVRKEMQWGETGNAGNMVVEPIDGDG